MKLVLLGLCMLAATCQPLPYTIHIGAYYQTPHGDQIGASVELDPAFRKEKK